MKSLKDALLAPRRTALFGAPAGYDALLLARLAREAGGRGLVHVATDDARLAMLAESLSFFARDCDILSLPAWDCLPYDRVSPNGDILGRRVDALTRLLQPVEAKGGRILLTTVSSILQKVPARIAFSQSVLSVKVGQRVEVDDLVAFFVRNGYVRADTVREAGEYAVRGGIVDVFPSGAPEPLRIDLFGDEVEGIRSFDPVSQRTIGKEKSILFKPVGEVFLDEESIQRFRNGYRQAFGAETGGDPLYEAISAGRRHMGMEHWLPLFHDRLETLFDYAPQAAFTFDHQAQDAIEGRLDLINEYYEARRSMQRASGQRGTGVEEGQVYKPLPPGHLYLMGEALPKLLAVRASAYLSPFAPPEAEKDETGRLIADAGGRVGHDFAEARARPDINLYDAVRDAIKAEQDSGRRVAIAAVTAGSRDRLSGLLREHGIEGLTPVESWPELEKLDRGAVALTVMGVERGFTTEGVAVIAEQDILGERLSRPAKRKRKADAFIAEASTLAEGDLVVHVEHGIGRYDGLITLEVGGAPHDCLRLLYAGGDKLFVPVENIDTLSRYGSEDAGAQLDKLGGVGWQARKARVKQRIREMAEKLIRVAAERQLKKGEPVTPPEGLFDEFCARFPYSETDDQLRAIEEVLEDMASGRPMDRLVCGDVGFGKTEVALRTAFVAAMAGMQVAVAVPTTLLARQHFRTFRDRFQGLPVTVRQLSRMVTAKEATETKKGLADGSVDIVVGTHALLAKSVSFNRLGLMIVDEEQHFGVAQKERLKEFRANIHVLTLTATPIPRTLQMALSGVREMSIIATPPVDRLAVRTFVMPYDGVIIREAIMREHYRGGKCFYVCPRLEDLGRVSERLRNLVPECKIAVAHGQMPPTELENVMTQFTDGAYDILLSTNIVESGLDIPSANTLIIHRADMFGLAQLYQLRGRVGRSKTRAYAYMTLHPHKKLTPNAVRRLEVMQTLDTLGAGFTLASYDLDIRGAGNMLGEEQSGHIKEVGVELYQHLLEEAIAELRSGVSEDGPAAEEWTPQIAIGMPVLIPEAYVSDLSVRLNLYRRIATLIDRQEIDSFAAEMIDRFGPLPEEVENLLQTVAIKRLCRQAGIDKVDAGPKGAVVSFRNNNFANPAGLVHFISKQAGSVQLRPDHKLVCKRPWGQPDKRVAGLNHLLGELVKIAA
ncbi:transcription-repair coupling factor [Oceanibaculum pacificum]|uniref:Transcription-repair-coupling factor n=1 Tax=Oceanibaculum pacificum TaxID=580166 RepID=A0A154VQY7_9PROT|nr:transcription-repair coupling factor [Oceanibaculum pacificum]KZD03723.1 transcription-repair coupling factor [Oceanibaculum pacificum]